MNVRPSQAALAELLSLNVAMVTQHAELASTIARTQKLIAALAVQNLYPDAPPAKPVAAKQAGAGDEGSEPAPAKTAPKPKPGPKPKRTINRPAPMRDKILDLWFAGELTTAEIVEVTGSTMDSVAATITQSRRRGDPRAVARIVPGDPTRKSLKQKHAEAWEAILDAYAAGETLVAIAEKLGMSEKAVGSVLKRARWKEDPRARARPRPVRAPKPPKVVVEKPVVAKPVVEKPVAPPRPVATSNVVVPIVRFVPPVAPAPAIVKAPPPVAPDDDAIMVVGQYAVHGPRGVEDRLGPTQLALCKRLADGGMYPEPVLAEASGSSNGTLTYMLNAMRPKLADIGVALSSPMRGYWTAARLGE